MSLNKRARSLSYVPSALPQRVRQHGDHRYYRMLDWEQVAFHTVGRTDFVRSWGFSLSIVELRSIFYK